MPYKPVKCIMTSYHEIVFRENLLDEVFCTNTMFRSISKLKSSGDK